MCESVTSYLLVEQVLGFDFDFEEVAFVSWFDFAIGTHDITIGLLLLAHVLLFVD